MSVVAAADRTVDSRVNLGEAVEQVDQIGLTVVFGGVFVDVGDFQRAVAAPGDAKLSCRDKLMMKAS